MFYKKSRVYENSFFEIPNAIMKDKEIMTTDFKTHKVPTVKDNYLHDSKAIEHNNRLMSYNISNSKTMMMTVITIMMKILSIL